MATLIEKDVLIEFIANTMIDIRAIASIEDRQIMKDMRHDNYCTSHDKINYQDSIKKIKEMRKKYQLDSKKSKGRTMLSIENTVKLKSLKIFEKEFFEFKDGWVDLVYNLGKDITELCELTNCELPMIQQIKEKMGTLRFYYNTLNSEYPEIVEKSIRALVDKAENKSANTCEVCGKYGEARVTGIGLWFTACELHKEDSMKRKEWEELSDKRRAEKLAPEYKI